MDSLFNQDINNIANDPLISRIVLLLVIAIVFWLIVFLIRRAAEKYIEQSEARYKFKKVVGFVAFIMLVFAGIVVFTGKSGYFPLSIGLITAGVAFALQEVILSIAGWVVILTGNIYQTGDRVELEGIKGDVIDVGVMKTTVMEIGGWINSDNYSGRMVKIANRFVFKGPVINYSSDFPFLWDEINIPIKYDSEYQTAENIILEAANDVIGEYSKTALAQWKVLVKKYLIEDARIAPSVVWAANDNWVGFNLRYVVDFKKRRVTKSEITKRILNAIDKTNGKVTIASTTFEIVSLPKINVDLNKPPEA